ncbi:3-hydroxyanthranilate 3,4-dioxygenase [Burkholderia pseudomallei]|uniref:3-hydroxyanthranilate 3,4-dioxygenase n=1 Tax=Burkholderia pseudomallei TaxID=28450 RepID=UPI00190D8836|nr:3-hydroxyanthranilate 3,4-dioxygenase [Burkholderia pseudomallei]MBK3337780.1 3-hydroxyanthranilate 3,4-dioxygenase [Burkholderia pseudomallei]
MSAAASGGPRCAARAAWIGRVARIGRGAAARSDARARRARSIRFIRFIRARAAASGLPFSRTQPAKPKP